MSDPTQTTDAAPAQDATTIFPNDHTAYEFRLVDARKRLLGSYEDDFMAREQVDLVFTKLMDDESMAELLIAKPDIVQRANVIRDALDRLTVVEEQAAEVAKGAKEIAGLCKAAQMSTRRRYKRLLDEATREEARREAEARKKRKGPLFGDEPPLESSAREGGGVSSVTTTGGGRSVTLTSETADRITEQLEKTTGRGRKRGKAKE